MTSTFRKHFDEDMARSASLLRLANGAAPVMKAAGRADDVRLAAVAMAVGAMDAYFCDAYADCLAMRLQSAKAGQLELPESYEKRNLPTTLLIAPPQNLRQNWALRMAARQVMENENVLDLGVVTGLFNPVLPQGKTLWENAMEPIIRHDWKRLTGLHWSDYQAIERKKRPGARRTAVKTMKARIKTTIQYRHDWIHNCGRPKSKVQTLTPQQAVERIREVHAVVVTFDDHLMAHRKV